MKKIALVTIALAFASSSAFGAILFTESFEDVTMLGAQYVDLGDALLDHDLVNNTGEAAVDGPGFDASYVNTRDDVGLTDGDYCGVTDYTPSIGYFTDGDQGYQITDADGKFVLTFPEVPGAGSVALDLFILSTGYESDDLVKITYGSAILFDSTGVDINDLGVEGVWLHYTAAVTGGQLVVEVDCNAGTEGVYIDNIVIADDASVPTEDSSWGELKGLYR